MDRQDVAPSLWDVEDDSTSTTMRVADMTVAPAGKRDVEEFCRRYHYTSTGGNMSWRWGLWHGVTLMGVVAYNLPTRETCESVFGSDHFDKVWHMGRLALAEDAPRNSESRLISGSLKAIHNDHPNTWGVLTYAATDVGHIGYVYQATNAIYTGTGGHAVVYIDEKGRRRSDYYASSYVSKSEALSRGWQVRVGGPKHRYLYVLGNKTQRKERMRLLRLPSLPYPKATREDRANHCEDCFQQNDRCPECPCHEEAT